MNPAVECSRLSTQGLGIEGYLRAILHNTRCTRDMHGASIRELIGKATSSRLALVLIIC